MKRVVIAGLAAVASLSVYAQSTNDPALKPPAGAKVALIEFADLECPACGADNPTIKAAAIKYNLPWVRHDFPLPYHQWSTQGAINARWFDTKSKQLGGDYRDAVFANQRNLATLDDLQQFTQKFAQQHGTALPFVVDPQGRFAADVKADAALGQRLGVHQTPTVWVATAHSAEIVSDMSKLYETIDRALHSAR